MDTRFCRMDTRFCQMDMRFCQMDKLFCQMDMHFCQMDMHFCQLPVAFGQLPVAFGQLPVRFDRCAPLFQDLAIERMPDWFVFFLCASAPWREICFSHKRIKPKSAQNCRLALGPRKA